MASNLLPLSSSLRPVRLGLLLCLLTVFFGFALGGAFGAAEDGLKADLKSRGEAVLASAYQNDPAKLTSTIDKAWSYYKRAHLHGGAIGTAGLVCLMLLASMARPPQLLKSTIGVAFGLGGLAYSLYWLLAGYRAPALGSTSAAKASLEWLAVPSAGAVLLSLLAVIVLAAAEWLLPQKETN
jgi:uncharacterized membrane protein YebE (DUF533 family)